jgi:hypothetical protein
MLIRLYRFNTLTFGCSFVILSLSSLSHMQKSTRVRPTPAIPKQPVLNQAPISSLVQHALSVTTAPVAPDLLHVNCEAVPRKSPGSLTPYPNVSLRWSIRHAQHLAIPGLLEMTLPTHATLPMHFGNPMALPYLALVRTLIHGLIACLLTYLLLSCTHA